MDVLRTDDERDNAKARHEGNSETEPSIEPVSPATPDPDNLEPKDYTISQIQDMTLTRQQTQLLLDREQASMNPRPMLVQYLERKLEEDS